MVDEFDWSRPDKITAEIRRGKIFDKSGRLLYDAPVDHRVILEPGNTITVAGFFALIPNPARKWWQFWRPRMVRGGELQTFTVHGK